MIQSNIASAGKADAFLKPSYVSMTRHVYEDIACSLYTLQPRSYNEYVESATVSSDEEIALDFEGSLNKLKSVPNFNIGV